MSNQVPNKFKMAVLKGILDLGSDTLKMILMQPGFVFNKATHGVYADVSSSEIAAVGTTYAVGGSACTGKTITQDDTLNVGKLTITHPGWTVATGNTLGPVSGAIIYDDTCAVTNHVKQIVAYIDFSGDKTVIAGGLFSITDPVIKIS